MFERRLSMEYTEKEIIKECKKRLAEPSFFYKKDLPVPGGASIKRKDIINYNGVCIDTGEYYTEVVARFLCEHIAEFNKGLENAKVTRKERYNVDGHNCEYDDNSPRIEENLAKKMCGLCKYGNEKYDFIGELVDYQIPLKDSNDEKNVGLGKIDLLSWDGETLRILELKKPDSDETMLRCVLEGYTYLRIVDTKKLAKNFEHEDAEVKASPFVFVSSNPYQEMKEERPWLKKLMKLLDSKPFYIKGDFPYKVTDEI